MPKIMVLGGYGNFGKRIAVALAAKNIEVLIVGRNLHKAKTLAKQIGPKAEALCFDAFRQLDKQLSKHKPAAIINTVGPFQDQQYDIALTAIKHGIHYIDLADGRKFVTDIACLNDKAKTANVAVISGASTVPALSDAVVRHYRNEFSAIELMKYGISPGQKAERGLATTKAILSYVGKPLAPFQSDEKKVFGWQDIYRQSYPVLGKRWMANCDVPDLDLLPEKHNIKQIRFSAGLELPFLHLGLWMLSWFVRLGLPLKLSNFAQALLSVSNWFNFLGSPDGGMHIILSGNDKTAPQKQLIRQWFIVAKDGHGPHIPTIPAIILTTRMAKGMPPQSGAYPCVDQISLDEYLAELNHLNIKVTTHAQ